VCRKCGVLRLIDRIAEADLSRLYAYYYGRAEPRPADLEEQLRNPTFAHRRARLERVLGARPRRLFEVGCGDGNFLAALKRANWEVGGSEISADSAELVRRRHDLAVMVGDPVRDMPPDAPYGVVGAYHVFEHVYWPAAWLRAIRRLLTPDGLLHLQLPNRASLTARLTGRAWMAYTFPQHVYFYTPGTLGALLTREGFTPISTTTWDPWHGPGTTEGSLGNAARYLLTGRLPWTLPNGAGAASAAPPVPHAPALASRGRPLLHAAGVLLSRVEAQLGCGAVIDVIARRN
jgi:SAM-dependent methyltransferase